MCLAIGNLGSLRGFQIYLSKHLADRRGNESWETNYCVSRVLRVW